MTAGVTQPHAPALRARARAARRHRHRWRLRPRRARRTDPSCPPTSGLFLASVLGLYVVAHLAVRRFAPGADATLLPLAARAQRHRLRHDLTARPRARAHPGRLGRGRQWSRSSLTLLVVRNTRMLERYRYTFALLGVRRSCCSRCSRASAGRSTARGCGCASGRSTSSPARSPRCCSWSSSPRTSPTTASCSPRAACASGASSCPRSAHLGPLAARVGLLDPRDGVREGPRLEPAVLRRVRGDALHGDRTRVLPRRRRSCCSSIGAFVAYQLFGHVQVRVDTWIDPWHDAADDRLPDHPVVVRVRHGRVRGHRPRPRQPRQDPERRRPTSCSPRSARSSGCIGTVGVLIGVHAVRRQRVPDRGRRDPPVLQAVRGRHRDDHRLPDRSSSSAA